jgi:hypothetical protein
MARRRRTHHRSRGLSRLWQHKGRTIAFYAVGLVVTMLVTYLAMRMSGDP